MKVSMSFPYAYNLYNKKDEPDPHLVSGSFFFMLLSVSPDDYFIVFFSL